MDREDIAELFSPYGPVSIKRMFSGFGLYAEDVCFAVFLRGELFIKTDPSTIPRFEAEGSTPFSYSQTKSGKVIVVNSFWRLPERLYDEPDELVGWTREAVRAAHALRMKKTKPRAVKKPKPKTRKKTVAKARPRRKARRA